MDIIYNHLSQEDVHKLKDLNRVFGIVFEDKENYMINLPKEAYLKELLGKDHFIAITAEYDNQVIAGLAAYVLDKFEMERKEVYIYDLAVNEEFRRKRVATNLIMKLKEIASKMNAYVIFVQADYVDEPAIKLYESLGEREEVLHYDIKVDKK